MENTVKSTRFQVDPHRCTGCGTCAAACPMHILDVQQGCCRMTNALLCLECGTCVRVCPCNALTVSAGTEADSAAAAQPSSDTVAFTRVLDRVGSMAQAALSPCQVFSWNGLDISDIVAVDTPEATGFVRCCTAEKILKLYQQRFVFFGQLCVEVFGIVPAREYDLPIFMFDWSETADGIFFACDFFPTDDPGRNRDYLENYLYRPLEEIYQDCSTIPGLKPSPLHWVRAISSPYMITGSVEKTPRRNVGRLFSCATGYLSAWLGLWETARPRDIDSPAMQAILKRRRVLNRLYRENDPGIGSINKFIGEEKGHKVLEVILPE